MPERKSYVARLMKEALIAEAYMAWVNSLTRDQRKRLGLLYTAASSSSLVTGGSIGTSTSPATF